MREDSADCVMCSFSAARVTLLSDTAQWKASTNRRFKGKTCSGEGDGLNSGCAASVATTRGDGAILSCRADVSS
jgi:hypothetical protein